MKENPENDVQKLIRLKRYERPDESYFDAFFEEFQRRQRAELLHRSAHGLFCERLATYLSGFGKEPWFIGAGAAAVLTAGYFYMGPQPSAARAPQPAIDSSLLWDASMQMPRPAVEPISPALDPSNFSFGELVPVKGEPAPRDF